MTHTQRIESERTLPDKVMVFTSVASVALAALVVGMMMTGRTR